MGNTIKLKKYSDVIEEYVAAGVITPGMLVEYNVDGEVVADTGENEFPMFALEDELQGNGIDDDYAAADPVQCWIPYRGDQVFGLLTGADVIAGDYLQSAGDGTLEKYVPEAETLAYPLPKYIVAQALEAVAPDGETVRVKARMV